MRDRLPGLAEPDVDRRLLLLGGAAADGKAIHARELARPQLREPQVLGQPVVELPGEPGALLEARPIDLT